MPIWQHEAKPSQGIRGLPPSPLQMTELAFIAVLNVVIPKFDNLRLPAMSPFGVCVGTAIVWSWSAQQPWQSKCSLVNGMPLIYSCNSSSNSALLICLQQRHYQKRSSALRPFTRKWIFHFNLKLLFRQFAFGCCRRQHRTAECTFSCSLYLTEQLFGSIEEAAAAALI